LQYRPEDGHALIRHFAADYDWTRAVQQPDKDGNFYLWCNIVTMIPTRWHAEIGGFDEDMPSWEDWDYWIRMARSGKCFVHTHEPTFVYRFYTGSRRWIANPEHEKGLQLAQSLVQYMREKYHGGEVVSCGGCGGSRRRTMTSDYPSMITQVTKDGIQTGSKVNDSDFVLCEFLGIPPGNTSEQGLVGVTVFPDVLSGVPMIGRDSGWSIDYRYKKAGDRFLVHREDLNRSPNWFRPTELDKKNFESTLPKQRQNPLPPPQPKTLAETLEEAVEVPGDVGGIPEGVEPATNLTPASQPITNPTAEIPSIPTESQEEITEEQAVRSMMGHVLDAGDLAALPGVTPGIARQMQEAGIINYQQILELGVSGLIKFRGVADTRANMIIDAINAMALNQA
jgi:predicted flap endonuclease-1-like 5' DNA nuclease